METSYFTGKNTKVNLEYIFESPLYLNWWSAMTDKQINRETEKQIEKQTDFSALYSRINYFTRFRIPNYNTLCREGFCSHLFCYFLNKKQNLWPNFFNVWRFDGEIVFYKELLVLPPIWFNCSLHFEQSVTSLVDCVLFRIIWQIYLTLLYILKSLYFLRELSKGIGETPLRLFTTIKFLK